MKSGLNWRFGREDSEIEVLGVVVSGVADFVFVEVMSWIRGCGQWLGMQILEMCTRCTRNPQERNILSILEHRVQKIEWDNA